MLYGQQNEVVFFFTLPPQAPAGLLANTIRQPTGEMFQLPVNNLSRLRKARKRVKRLLSDIGLDYCKEHVKDFKEFGPDEFSIKHLYLDVCMWDPSWTKSQDYRTKQFCCSDCPFASKYFSAYKNHFRNVHREDFENRILLNCSYCMYSGNKWTLETHVRLFHMPHNLVRQGITTSHQAVVGGRDLQIHKSMFPDKDERPVYYCKKCNYRDRLYNVVRRHIYGEHFQHVAAPYVTKSSEEQENNKMAQINSHGLHCKSCLFVFRSYETLVQHVIEIHERTGHQVTGMIGHTSVTVSTLPRYQTNVIQRGTTVPPGVSHHLVQPVNCINMPEVMGLLVGKQLKHTGKSGQPLSIMLPKKTLSGTVSQSHAGKRLGSLGFTSSRHNATFSPPIKSLSLSSVHVGTATLTSLQTKKASANILNTSQTQNWKICIICNKLFPESVYSTHFEQEHQAKKVQAMATYIMKIHSFTSKCLYCNLYLLSDSLLNHILVHGMACPQCHSTFYEVEKIIAHKQQAHLNEPEDHPTGSLLIFDLTFQHGNPKNVQLIVTTYSKKEAPELSFTTAQPLNSAIARSTMLANKEQDKFNEPLMRIASQRPQKKEAGKTLCPLCFTILKGHISDALAHHLQNQHQVLQTLHPVEKKLTYRCIHCLGVYTSNMTASMIKLHLVHCRGAGQSEIHCSKFISTLKRDIAASDTSYKKKRKLVNQGRYNPTIFVDKLEKPIVLALDPKGHADESYNARKFFLTSYFNSQPYPCQQEVEKLATSLWLWKSDVSNHFANNRQLCKEDFASRKPVVLLGFNMIAVNQLNHNINFDSKWVFTVSDKKKSEKARTSKIRLKSYGFSAEEGSDIQIKCACKPLLGSFLDSLTFDSYGKLEQAATFCSSVVQTRIKGTVLKDNLIHKRDEKMSSNCTKGDAMCFDSSVYRSSPEKTTWSGDLPPDKNTYSSAGRFDEEFGLLGR